MLATHFAHARLSGVRNVRQTRVNRIDHRTLTNEMFDSTIFERMKTDHGHAAARREHVECRLKTSLQLPEFVIDMHPQRLKGARSRVLAIVSTHDSLHELGKLARASQRCFGTTRDDGSGDAPRMPLFTEFSDHLKQLPFIRASDEVRCRLAARGIHAHIERTVFGKTEPSGGIVELRRGDTEIEQHTTNRPTVTVLRDHTRQLRKVRVHEFETWLVDKSLMACCDSLRIAIEREHAARGTDRLQQTRCVTTPTESAIDIKTARGRGQNLQHLVDKHRYVLIHRSSPLPERPSSRPPQ